LALTATIENYHPVSYIDSGGLNVGYGYCITARVKNVGANKVKEQLAYAGISEENIKLLVDKRTPGIKIDPIQALKLLWITHDEYKEIAKNVFEDNFDKLPKYRRAVLTWMAYNTGENGLRQFKRLARAIDEGNFSEAAKQLTPYYFTNGGFVKNKRAGTLLSAAWWSMDGFEKAIAETELLIAHAKEGNSPISFFSEEEANIPNSPYSNTKISTKINSNISTPKKTFSELLSSRNNNNNTENKKEAPNPNNPSGFGAFKL
jgi:GH24 family phage-related lysozyme (muramidase)